MHRLTPPATAMARTVPTAAFPRARLHRSGPHLGGGLPAFKTPASVVSKRTWAAVMHTVPSGMLRSASGGWSVSKESTPTAAVAARRSRPAVEHACPGSPLGRLGKHCRPTQSACTYRA